MKKEDVYFFAKNVEILLKTLEGLEIRGEENKLSLFSDLYLKLESEVIKFQPTIKEEYSIKTKNAYFEMKQSKELFEKGTIKSEEYEKAKLNYINCKKIRDAIKGESK